MKIVKPKKSTDPIMVVMDENSDTMKAFEQVMRSKTRKKPSGIWFLKNGRVIVFHKGIFHVFNHTNKDEIEKELREKEAIGFPDAEAEIGGPIYYYGYPGTLYSPPSVPDNAFPVYDCKDAKIKYIQITQNAIVLTNGVFFSKDKIGEGENETLFVKRTNLGWQAWYPGNMLFIEGNKLWDNKIPYNYIKEHFPVFISSYNEHVLVPAENEYKVYLYIDYKKFDLIRKYPKNIFQRVKVNVNNKQLYYPLHELCTLGWCP